jgi:SAM-dependent methyltransferase
MSELPAPEHIKAYIKRVYGRLASAGTANLSRVPVASGENLARALGYDTDNLPIAKEAWALFAGCGNPLETIDVEPEWTVVDLGCGVGIDCQVAAHCLGSQGRAVGIDITGELLRRARTCAGGDRNIHCHWVLADGEHLPLGAESVDLLTANGSFNLMPHKQQALAEIHRVLRPDGHLAMADLIRLADGEPITDGFEDAWSWCVAGALSIPECDNLLKGAGFSWRWLTVKTVFDDLASAHVLTGKGKRPRARARDEKAYRFF